MGIFCIIGFIAISLTGSLLHFVYDWLGHSKIISLFVAVNESTWEHLKLAIIPTFIWAIIGSFFGFNNYAFAVFVVLCIEVLVIPIIFYSYTHFTKKPILAIDISSFFIAIGIAMLVCYWILSSTTLSPAFDIIGTIGCIVFAILTILWTYFPPKCFLFRDPITNKYGRAGHYDDKDFGNDYSLKKK